MSPLPTLFLSHGAPNMVLHDIPARRFFDGLAASLPAPQAILVASAHFDAPQPSVTALERPRTIHDFSGFEPELYTIRYDAPGSPDLAARVVGLLRETLEIEAVSDTAWGLDHGVWNPLSRMYPAADIPVVALSIDRRRDPAWHFALGRALEALRGEDVLVCGSGSITHNLSTMTPPITNDDAPHWAKDFLAWLDQRLAEGDEAALLNYRSAAPSARENHPTDEHLLPLYVALGAAGKGWRAEKLHASFTYGTLAMDAYAFN
jgi:4,5-DOPA dioxygenase extradiol